MPQKIKNFIFDDEERLKKPRGWFGNNDLTMSLFKTKKTKPKQYDKNNASQDVNHNTRTNKSDISNTTQIKHNHKQASILTRTQKSTNV